MDEKRRAIIGRIHNLQQELGNQDPTVYFALFRSYVFHLYGCQLWDISADVCNKLWAVWHRTIKLAYDLPHATHRYLLNDLVSVDHIKKLVIKRFTKFYQTINNSDILQVRMLNTLQSTDLRSTYCRNINHTLHVAGVRSMSEVNFSSIIINPVGSKQSLSPVSIFVPNFCSFLMIRQKIKRSKFCFIPVISFKIGYVKH